MDFYLIRLIAVCIIWPVTIILLRRSVKTYIQVWCWWYPIVLLLSFFWLPISKRNVLLWMPINMASILYLAYLLWQIAIKCIAIVSKQNDEVAIGNFIKSLTGPLLVILIIVVLHFWRANFGDWVYDQLFKEASQVQQYCSQYGTRPLIIQGWDRVPLDRRSIDGNATKDLTYLGLRTVLHYFPQDDRFTIRVRCSDYGNWLATGGVNSELKMYYRGNG